MFKKDGQFKKLIISVVLIGGMVLVLFPSNGVALDITRENIITLTNQDRDRKDLGILREDGRLTEAAQNKANDMIARGYWAHFYHGQTPWDWMKRAGYQYIDAGENLAIDFTKAEDINQAWLESASHRENLLNPKYQDIGIGISEGWFKDHNTIIVVQMFGRTKNSKQVQGIKEQPVVSQNLPERESVVPVNPEPTNFLVRALGWIGRNSILVWDSIKEAGHSSLAWIGSKILPGHSVFAD